jgi:hypothetical protein
MNTSFIIELATATANATAGDTSEECGFCFNLFLGIFVPISLIAICVFISEDMAKKRKKKRQQQQQQQQIQSIGNGFTPSISSQEPVGTLNYAYV